MKGWLAKTGARFWLLALWLLAVVLVQWELNRRGFDPQNDPKLLFVVSCVITISVLIMLATTTRWTLRLLGIFGMISFDAGIYMLAGQAGIWGWHNPTQRDLNILRAMLIVSAPLLFVSQVYWIGSCIRDWWRSRTEMLP